MSDKTWLPPMRLATQLVISMILVLIAVLWISRNLEQQLENETYRSNTLEQAAVTNSLIAEFLSQALRGNDRAALIQILGDVGEMLPALEYAAVYDQDGMRVAQYPETATDLTTPATEVRTDIEIDGQSIGRLAAFWTAEPVPGIYDAHVRRSVLITSLALILTMLLTMLLVSQLALRPMSTIHAKMAATLRRDKPAPGKLPGFTAQEFVSLSGCVDELERVLEERNAREADLKIAHEAMEAADKVKSEFLANMSHEIRTPMNAVLGMAELLLTTELSGDQRSYAETIAKSGATLMPVINDILDFSKMEAGRMTLHPEPFDLHRAIEDLVAMISTTAYQKSVEINLRYAPDLPVGFVGDAGRVRQIFTNILSNAVKFTLSGHILIDVSGQSDGNLVHLEFDISDTGIGIPEEKLRQISNELEHPETAAPVEGAGLGLSVTNQLVHMMGGTISLHSEAGKGSVFTIRLTLERARNIEPKNLADDQVLQGRKVLIVDDLKINRTVLSERLRNWGIIHTAAESGAQALQVLERTEAAGGKFDAIIVDYHMPQMNGYELATKIRAVKNCKTVPIILLSSVDVAGEPLSENQRIFEIYLLKPVRSDTLKAVLANAVETKGSEEMPEPEKAAPEATTSALSGKTVLIAEDNKTNQLVLQTMLKMLQVDVITAENGQEALQSYVAKEPDLILMDMAMPVMDGLDATRKIREFEQSNSRGRVPIIALTANAMTGDRDNCLNAGMDDYLSKPVIKSNLALTMQKWIDETSNRSDTEDKASDFANPSRGDAAQAS